MDVRSALMLWFKTSTESRWLRFKGGRPLYCELIPTGFQTGGAPGRRNDFYTPVSPKWGKSIWTKKIECSLYVSVKTARKAKLEEGGQTDLPAESWNAWIGKISHRAFQWIFGQDAEGRWSIPSSNAKGETKIGVRTRGWTLDTAPAVETMQSSVFWKRSILSRALRKMYVIYPSRRWCIRIHSFAAIWGYLCNIDTT